MQGHCHAGTQKTPWRVLGLESQEQLRMCWLQNRTQVTKGQCQSAMNQFVTWEISFSRPHAISCSIAAAAEQCMHATVVSVNLSGSQHSRTTQSYQLAACARATGVRAPARQGFAAALAPPQIAVEPRHAAQPARCRPIADGCKRLQPGNMSEAAVVSCSSSPCFSSPRRCGTSGLAKITQSNSAGTYVATKAYTKRRYYDGKNVLGSSSHTHFTHAATNWFRSPL